MDLSENPTTGYRWALEPDVKARVIDDTYPERGEPTPGAATRHRLVVAFDRFGEHELRMRLWRDWEGESSIIDRYQVNVRVE